MIGRTLSHYRILQRIGRGGMGEVYVAEDTKLGRKVALKILPAEMASNESRRKRFEREAKAVAALNHPNIVVVHSVEEWEGVHFITMELVRGKTLGELLPKNGLPLRRFFEIAIPLADAVAAAHEAGITHRDLKPENVMVGDDGRVKVLDFGLAKTRASFVEGEAASELPTETKTREGVLVGTLAYMSPEQAEGKPVDPRSDIFSLGVVFYQTLTGRFPFRGETPSALLSSILKDTPPPLTELKEDVPRELGKLVHRCLTKEPTRRMQSAVDLRNELEEIRADLDSGELYGGIVRRGPKSSLGWLAAGAILAVLAAAVLYFVQPGRETVPRLVRPRQLTSAVGSEQRPTWSPDGERLAYESNEAGNWDIWVAQVGGGGLPVNLTVDSEAIERSPSWSPDGRQIAFLTDRDGSPSLYVMSALGGSARRLARGLALHLEQAYTEVPQWSADSSELAVSVRIPEGSFVEIVDVTTHERRRVALPDHEGNPCLDLSWSPDGKTFAYVGANSWGAETTQLWLSSMSDGEPVPLTDGRSNDWNPSWSAGGRYLFFLSNRGGAMDLWRQRVEKGKPVGEPMPITAGLGINSAAFFADGARVAYSQGPRFVANVWRIPILEDRRATWADAEPITSDRAFAQYVDVSPDGERLAISSDRAGNQDLWILPSEGGTMIQLTTDPTPDWAPAWSPDGTQIAFFAYRSGNRDIWVMAAEGGPARQLTSHPAADLEPVWSPDGREVAFVTRRAGNADIWAIDLDEGSPRPVTSDAAHEGSSEYSRDGEWIYFAQEERLYRMAREGGEPELLSRGVTRVGSVGLDGETLYFVREPDVWALALDGRREHPVTDLGARWGGGLRLLHFSTDGRYLYFSWLEDVGDIWVMDVVQE